MTDIREVPDRSLHHDVNSAPAFNAAGLWAERDTRLTGPDYSQPDTHGALLPKIDLENLRELARAAQDEARRFQHEQEKMKQDQAADAAHKYSMEVDSMIVPLVRQSAAKTSLILTEAAVAGRSYAAIYALPQIDERRLDPTVDPQRRPAEYRPRDNGHIANRQLRPAEQQLWDELAQDGLQPFFARGTNNKTYIAVKLP